MQYGFFGNLEVISKTGVKLLTTYLDECHAVFAPYLRSTYTNVVRHLHLTPTQAAIRRGGDGARTF